MTKHKRRNRYKNQEEDVLVDIGQTTDRVSEFFEENQNIILGVLAGIILLVGGYYAYMNFVKKPQAERAVAEIYQAELQFERDSFSQALTNPGGGFMGFLDIVDEYGGTPTGNLAKYYAGISYLNLGSFEEAIEYLEDFKTTDDGLRITKFGALGDAYSELGEFDKALKNYKKAVQADEVDAVSSIYLERLALLHYKQGNTEEALEAFEQLKADYPNTAREREADKYIALLN